MKLDYSSLGASCSVEVELEHSLVFDDVEAFQARVTHAYAVCRQAVSDELGITSAVPYNVSVFLGGAR